MSEVQKRLFVLDQAQGENISYNIPMAFKVDQAISIEKLKIALNKMIMNHEILRTSFTMIDGEYCQLIGEPWDIKIEQKKKQQTLQEAMYSFIYPFDLAKPELFRVQFFEGREEQFLLFDFHHIIFDGGSIAPFFEELSQMYQGASVDKPKIQYRHYTIWKNSLTEERHEGYWLEKFSSGVPILELYTDFSRGQTKTYKGDEVINRIDEEQSKRIKLFCRKNRISEYSFFLAALYILLQRHSLQNDLVIGTPTSGRSHPETGNMLGMFVNTLALKVNMEGTWTVKHFLNHVNKLCLESFSHQEYPFEQLLSNLSFNTDSSRNPLFDVMLVLQNNDKTTFTLGEVNLIPVNVKNQVSKFDLTLSIEDLDSGFEFFWEYNVSLFKESTVQRYSQQYLFLLNELLTEAEKELTQVALAQSETRISHTENRELKQLQQTIIEKFTFIVQKYPEDIALRFGSEQMTYLELDKRSSVVGEHLRKSGVKKEDIVGFMTDKSFEMIIGILGILKSGAAYLPLDSGHSPSRLEYMLTDSSVKTLLVGSLADSEVLQRLKCENVLYINQLEKNCEVKNEYQGQGSDLAYIIYTSGTTGHPKGVLVEHQGVVNLAEMQSVLGDYQPGDQVMQYFNYIFDGSVSEIFSALLNGCTLKILSEEVRLAPKQLISEMKDTHCQLVPSLFSVLFDYSSKNCCLDDLFAFKKLYLAGETFPVELAEKTYDLKREKLKDVFNLYGPTENTVCATAYSLAEYVKGQKVPIGRPVAGNQVIIMQQDQECGIGLVGEICLSGVGLARGYLNQQKLTNDTFIKHPFRLEERIYRTGDFGRWNEDGQIEYLGRIDDQMKFRGFRIECREIEDRIRKITQVKDVVVTVNIDTGNEYLAAYILSDAQLKQNEIVEQLSEYLPDYMIPSFYLCLEEFPTNSSGKVDRKLLQQLGGLSTSLTDEDIDVQLTETQKTIKEIFERTLNIEKISLNDSFFSFGGNSLKAIEVINLIEDFFSIQLAIQDVLTLKTVENVSRKIEELKEKNDNDNCFAEDMMIFEAEEL
ncbi:amino acid adenylation domain-containing protein [Enterococcus quebecensis]|nr:amino acid adenylation domain-containing protein [Enterococcus quebecensis]